MLLSLNKNPNNHSNNNNIGLPYKRSSNTQKSLSSFAIRWGVTVLVINAALINQTNGFKTVSGESRKLFGGYRITPKQCRATKTLPSSDPRAKGPTICMFNHECAQRNGEVVGACMDGFLFGACCQVPKNQQPEHTLINDAQNSYYHQYQNQKIQQQETETNKIVSQAYETFAENSAQQQQLLENSQTENTGYGSTISNNVIGPSASYNQESPLEEINTSTGTGSSTNSVAESAENEDANTNLETNYITESQQTSLPSEPPKINIKQESVKVSSPSQAPQSDDFVLHVLSTLPPKGGNKIIAFATEIPTKISSGTTEHISSESNSFEEEAMAATKKPETMPQTAAVQPLQPEANYHTESEQPQNSEHHTDVLHDETEELFGGASFTHSDITHPGADTELIEDDLQFSTGYGPQPVFVPAPHKSPESYSQDNNKHNSHILDATTSSSSITTHVDSIETIIQQLNNNDSNPGPAYSVINHHEQHQQQPQHEQHPLQSATYNNKLEVPTKRPVLYNEEENTKHTSLASISYNEIQQNDKPDPVNLYGETSSSTILSYAPHTSESTTVNSDEFVLEDHTIPHSSYNDFDLSKHPTSDFNKMPPIGIAYPVDMSYIEEEGELESAVQHETQHQNNQISNLSIKNQQNDKDTHANTAYQPSQQQHNSQSNENKISQSPTVSNYVVDTHQQQQQPLGTYSSQHEEQNLSHPQTIETFVTDIHQRPISSYVGMVTSQSYNPQPVPNEVVVSSHTTKIEENAEVSTEYKPIITTNQIITTYKTTKKPVQHTSYTRRPTIVTKKPSGYKKPAQANNQRPTTNTYVSTNSIITQQHYSTKPIETKTPSPAEPTVSYNQGIKQNYIISSGSTPRPIVTRKPTKKQNVKPASTSYITGPTTPRPLVTPALQYGQEISIIQADDKLDSFVHSTAESLAAATPAQEAVSYDPPVFISAGSLNQNQRPQYSTHKKPGFVKVSPTQRPPAPTVLITPKPSSLQTSATSFTTAHHTTAVLPGYGSTSLLYNSLITKRPDFIENSAGDYMGISTVNSNDFDDPGYNGAVDHIKPANPLYVSGSTNGVYPVPTDDKPAFPGYYGPTPSYPAFHVPGEKLESPIDDGVYTSINDFVNFPPVRNPNLSMSATSSVVTNDFDLSTPAFVEDKILKNKMNTLVNKIVESLQGNFEALAEMIDDNNTTAVQTYQAAALNSTLVTKKPTRKPTTKTTTVKPKVTTKKTVTRVTTKKTATTRKPDTTTKRPAAKRTTTTTKRPATRKPTRKTTTTKAPIDYDLADEEDEEDINPSDNEIPEEDESYGAGGSGRKIQCGMRPQIKSGRIVGGKDAAFGAYPWQVLVRESMWLGLFTKNKCGGVLITNRYVITAAHCQTGFLAYLVAVMGEFDISGDLESKRAITKNVKRVIVHRQYDPATFENDIALLELESPVTFDSHIVPICMPSDIADFTGRMATVTGWGRLTYKGGVPPILQEVQVPIIENSVCQEMFHTAGHDKKILNSFLCAGYANGQKDSCEGDSGGPLVLQRADGRYELAGTVSHGIKCAAPYLPGVYMRTTFYKPWLRSITGVK